jgi:uncharacterized protein with ParB-like and HNH nuclease domain
MKITCVDQEVLAILQSAYYVIPRFQRPYAWDAENIDDFLDDVIGRGSDDYFIGSIVVYDEDKGVFAVVDGQQRLTTITLMLCALRDVFDELEDRDSALGLQQLIERQDLRAKMRFVLQTPTGYPYFQDTIQRHGEAKREHEIGPDEKRLTDAFDRIKSYVQAGIIGYLEDETKRPKARRESALERLEDMRDNVLGLKLIFIQVDSPDDAYFIFETLNTRGKDLGVSDLVRNLLLSHLKQDNADVDLARDDFEQILHQFRSAPTAANVNKFLLHQWLSEYSYISEAKLYRAIRSEIGKKEAQAYLDRLKSDATLYRAISEPRKPLREWTPEERTVRESLMALSLFGVTQPLPMLLALARAYDRKDIKLATLKKAVRAIEDFHFAFTAVASQPSSGGISSMYALHARELTAASGPKARTDEIKKLINKLALKRPTKEVFVAGFRDLRASELYSKQKPLVAYILRRFHADKVGSPPPVEDMSLEHIANQGNAVDDELVAMVGNLLYVNHDLNGKLGNKSFAAKQKILKAAKNVCIDDSTLSATSWGKEQIDARTVQLAEIAYDRLWKIKA